MNNEYYGVFFCLPKNCVLINNILFDKKFIAIVPPNKEYYKLTKNNSYQFSITIKKELFQEFFPLLEFKIIDIEDKYFTSFKKLIISILNKNNLKDLEYYEFKILSYLKFFLTQNGYIDDTCMYFNRFYEITTYIKKQNKYNISIDELALRFKVSDRTLRNIFYTIVGMSPKKYFRTLQLNNLRKKLSQENLNISQLIIEQNLPPHSQTSKEFKEIFYSTPPKYKKTLNNHS